MLKQNDIYVAYVKSEDLTPCSAMLRTIDNHYLYTGQEYDGSISSLYNLRARYYKPDIGRFISEDPVGHSSPGTSLASCGRCCNFTPFILTIDVLQKLSLYPQVLNPYVYVENNPINFSDALGFIPYQVACGIIYQCELQKCIKGETETLKEMEERYREKGEEYCWPFDPKKECREFLKDEIADCLMWMQGFMHYWIPRYNGECLDMAGPFVDIQ